MIRLNQNSSSIWIDRRSLGSILESSEYPYIIRVEDEIQKRKIRRLADFSKFGISEFNEFSERRI